MQRRSRRRIARAIDADLTALNQDVGILASCDPVLARLTADDQRDERLPVDEVVDACALILVARHVDPGIAYRDGRAAAVYDRRAIATPFRVGCGAREKADRCDCEMSAGSINHARMYLVVFLDETFRVILPATALMRQFGMQTLSYVE